MIPLALAVTSSSAFPPLFPPTTITRKMLEASNEELPYNFEFITDGGIYDNLGFAIFSRVLGSSACDINCLILSDASAQLDWDIRRRFTRVISRTVRSTDILMQRVADFTIASLASGAAKAKVFHLSIRRPVLPPDVGKPLLIDFQKKLAKIRTDLDRFSPLEVNCLIQHGDEVALAELRSLVESHPDFEELAKLSNVTGSALDMASSDIPAAARTLDKSRVRGLAYLMYATGCPMLCTAICSSSLRLQASPTSMSPSAQLKATFFLDPFSCLSQRIGNPARARNFWENLTIGSTLDRRPSRSQGITNSAHSSDLVFLTSTGTRRTTSRFVR